MARRPIIGISANLFPAQDRRFYKNKELLVVERSMAEAVIGAGGVPIALPVTGQESVIAEMCDTVDGLLLSGGADVDPSTYGAAERGWPGQPERDAFEISLVRHFRERRLPVLGVCRGHQVLNVALGGTLHQDIQTDVPTCHQHRCQERYDTLTHLMKIKPNTLIAQINDGRSEVTINSVHHQAIDSLASELEAIAWSDDGLIEAVWLPKDRWTYGVQWHPEWGMHEAGNRRLFEKLVEAAS